MELFHSFKKLHALTLAFLFLFAGLFGIGAADAQDTATADQGGVILTIPPQPEWPEPSWDTGSSLTYKISVGHQTGSFNLKTRIAILGSEVVAGETLYWIEFDITDITGLSQCRQCGTPLKRGSRFCDACGAPVAEDQEFFIQNYGEIPTSIRVKLELPRENLIDIVLDPSGFYHRITTPGYVESLVFQYNRQVPLDVDPALIGGWILPLGALMMLEGNLPDDFYDNRNIGVEVLQDSELYSTETSESSVTVESGSFEGSEFVYTSIDESAGNGTIFYSDRLSILPILMINANWAAPSRKTVEVELIASQESGAQSQIVGQPAPFNLQTLMSMGM